MSNTFVREPCETALPPVRNVAQRAIVMLGPLSLACALAVWNGVPLNSKKQHTEACIFKLDLSHAQLFRQGT